MSESRKKIIWKILSSTFILMIAVLSIFPLGLYFYVFHGSLSQSYEIWAAFGSYLSGVYGPLAFLGLIFSIRQTSLNFVRQSEDQRFYKLLDILQARTYVGSVFADTTASSGKSAFRETTETCKKLLNEECFDLGRRLLCEDPIKIKTLHYEKLFGAMYPNDRETANSIKNECIENLTRDGDFEKRWETLKYYIDYEPSERVVEALKGIGRVHFYKIPFYFQKLGSCRLDLYNRAVNSLPCEQRDFLESYITPKPP